MYKLCCQHLQSFNSVQQKLFVLQPLKNCSRFAPGVAGRLKFYLPGKVLNFKYLISQISHVIVNITGIQLLLTEDLKVCLNNTHPFTYQFTHTNTSHRVRLHWNESECSTVCNPCIINIISKKESHIVMEFPHLDFFFYETPKDQLQDFLNIDLDINYVFTDKMRVLCFNHTHRGNQVFYFDTEGVLKVAPIWCLGNLITLEITTGPTSPERYSSFDIEFYLHDWQNCSFLFETFLHLCRPNSIPPTIFNCDGIKSIYFHVSYDHVVNKHELGEDFEQAMDMQKSQEGVQIGLDESMQCYQNESLIQYTFILIAE